MQGVERVINLSYSIKEAINNDNRKAAHTSGDGEFAA